MKLEAPGTEWSTSNRVTLASPTSTDPISARVWHSLSTTVFLSMEGLPGNVDVGPLTLIEHILDARAFVRKLALMTSSMDRMRTKVSSEQ